MTKKDYERIAAVLKEAYNSARPALSEEERGVARGTVYHVADLMSRSLANDNPQFDRSRFLKAVGL